MKNINDEFFRGRYKDVWRQIIPDGLTEAETDFIEEQAGLKKGDKVLDVMCGYGRHSIELARRGYDVTAIDIEPDYISEINEKAAKENLKINTITGSVLTTVPDGKFDAIICMGNSFAFFPEELVKDLLRKFFDRLNPGGLLVINTWMIAEIAIRYFKDKEWHEMHGFRYLISNRFEFNPTRIESTHIIYDEKENKEELRAVDYIFTIRELQTLFSGAGFVPGKIFSTPRKKAFTLGDGKGYILANKPAGTT